MSILEMKSKLDVLFDVVNQETVKLEFDPKNNKSIYAVANHCTCLESANSIWVYAEACGLILAFLGSCGRNAATIFSLRYSSSR